MIICFPWATIGRAPLSIPLAIATVGGGLLIVPPHRDVPVGIAARPAAARAAPAAAHARRTVPVVLGQGEWCPDTGYRGWGYGSGIGGPWTSDYGPPLGGFGSIGGGYGQALGGTHGMAADGPGVAGGADALSGLLGSGGDGMAAPPLGPMGGAPGVPGLAGPVPIVGLTPQPVPEPATLTLLCAGLLALLILNPNRSAIR